MRIMCRTNVFDDIDVNMLQLMKRKHTHTQTASDQTIWFLPLKWRKKCVCIVKLNSNCRKRKTTFGVTVWFRSVIWMLLSNDNFFLSFTLYRNIHTQKKYAESMKYTQAQNERTNIQLFKKTKVRILNGI